MPAAVKLLRAIVALGEAPAEDIPGLLEPGNLYLKALHADVKVDGCRCDMLSDSSQARVGVYFPVRFF